VADSRRSGAASKRPSRLIDLDALLNDLADRVADRLAHRAGPGPVYYSAKDNPLGSRRAFLDAALRGCFPSYKAGRRVLAKREEVHRWIESGDRRREEVAAPGEDISDRELLEQAGVPLRGKPRR
jgi:hypothetical protein